MLSFSFAIKSQFCSCKDLLSYLLSLSAESVDSWG